MKFLILFLFLFAFATTQAAELVLTWTDNSANETGFAIERAPKPDSGSAPLATYAEIARVGPNVVTFTDTGLPTGTAFSYRIRAFNAAGLSGYSNISTATTATVPPPLDPSALKVTPVPIARQ